MLWSLLFVVGAVVAGVGGAVVACHTDDVADGMVVDVDIVGAIECVAICSVVVYGRVDIGAAVVVVVIGVPVVVMRGCVCCCWCIYCC